MTTKLIPLLLLSLLAADASAQCYRDFEEEMERTVAAQRAQAEAKAKADAALDAKLRSALNTTLVAMNDGVPQGTDVVSFMTTTNIAVEFGDLLDLSAQQPGKIGLSRKIGAYPRAMGPRVAWEAAGMMLADMPDSSEKEYMRRSIAARVFIELGGDASKLPVMETLQGSGEPKDEVLSKELKLWLDNDSSAALKKIEAATGKKSLQWLLQGEDPDKPGPIDAAVKRYTKFMAKEREWRVMYPR
jgi:hypothetical protein